MKTYLQTLFLCLLITQICFAQSNFWEQTSGPVDPNSGIIETDITALANTDSGTIFCTIVGGNVFKTIDNGATWDSIPLPSPVTDAGIIVNNSNGQLFIADFWNSSLLRSTNNGSSWNEITTTPFYGQGGGGVRNITFNRTGEIFLIYDNPPSGSVGLYRSTNDGVSWDKVGVGLPNHDLYTVAISPNNDIFVGTGYQGLVFKSIDNGDNFIQTSFPSREWLNKIAVYSDGTVFVGGEGGFWNSTDNGDTWTKHNTDLVNISDPGVRDIVVDSSGNVFATPFDGGVAVSHDKGNTWTRIDGGLTTTRTINPLLIANDYLFVGTRDAGVFRSVNIVTAVEKDKNVIPDNFKLRQNYPNPFNPSTTIRFSILLKSFVTLKVYDLLGRELGSLVNEEKPAGNYQVEFNAANLPSGVYFYRLEAGSFVETKKMILLK
jgi:photosystem II stability/assembly factor-like uncharacterized protein